MAKTTKSKKPAAKPAKASKSKTVKSAPKVKAEKKGASVAKKPAPKKETAKAKPVAAKEVSKKAKPTPAKVKAEKVSKKATGPQPEALSHKGSRSAAKKAKEEAPQVVPAKARAAVIQEPEVEIPEKFQLNERMRNANKKPKPSTMMKGRDDDEDLQTLDENGEPIVLDPKTLNKKWLSLHEKHKAKKASLYNMKEVFEAKTPLLHKILGWGFIISVVNDRLEVLFKDGVRVLISNYKPGGSSIED